MVEEGKERGVDLQSSGSTVCVDETADGSQFVNID